MTTENKTDKIIPRYRLFGKCGLRVFPISIGAMTFGDRWKDFLGSTSDEDIEKILGAYHAAGGNFIDTANVYQFGQSEEKIAHTLKKLNIPRDDFVIATKYSNVEHGKIPNNRGNHKKSLLHAVELCLKRLQTHYIDILYVHFWDFTTQESELMRALDDVVRSGKVHHIAISDAPAWNVAICNTIADFHGWSQFVGYQGKYSLVNREMENDIIPCCEKLGVSVVPWAVLGQGKLTGKYLKQQEKPKDTTRNIGTMTDLDYTIQDEVIKIAKELNVSPSQVAINWAMQKPYIPSVLVGTRNFEQYEDAMKALNFKLTKEQMESLDKVSQPSIRAVFPHDFIGTSYKNNKWLTFRGDPFILE